MSVTDAVHAVIAAIDYVADAHDELESQQSDALKELQELKEIYGDDHPAISDIVDSWRGLDSASNCKECIASLMRAIEIEN